MTTFIAFDLETTGLDPRNDAIIELAFVRFDETGVLDTWTTLVNPGFSLPSEAASITGITDEDLATAPFFSDIRPKLLEFLADNSPLVGHNVEFDLSFLREYGVDMGVRPMLDTFRLSEFLFYREKSLNLGSLLEALGQPFTDQHRALGDTEATVALFRLCLDAIRALSPEKKQVLSYIAGIAHADSSLRFLLSYLGLSDGTGSADQIKQFILSRRLETAEKTFFKEENLELTWKDILQSPPSPSGRGVGGEGWEFRRGAGGEGFEEERSEGGSPTLEERPEQAKMLDLATGAFVEKELLLIEAPTGIGKTFAYGVPAILFSIHTGHQVFISTNTKTLQDQIFEKDIPMLHTLFGRHDAWDFTVAKIKGRSNYASLLLFFEYLESGMFDESALIFIAKMAFWLAETASGELDELVFYGPEYGFLERIRATDKRVLSPDNTYRKEEFLYRIRQDAKNANIVIMNHALLLSEIDTPDEAKILPGIRYLVIDEAHNLEAVATDALRQTVSLTVIEAALEGIDLIIKKQKRTQGTEPFIFPEFRNISESLVLNYGMLFDVCFRYLSGRIPQTGDTRYNQTLVEADFARGDGMEGARRILDALHARLHELLSGLYHAPESLYANMERHVDTLESSLSVMETVFRENEKDQIKIIASERDELTVSVTPLHVGKRLAEGFYTNLEACIATSATLSVNGDFSYIEKSLSLQSFKKHVLASDFDYGKQALIFIPSDIGDIKNESDRIGINEFIGDILRAVGGRTLGLFTSFSSIKETYLQINAGLKQAGVHLMTQGLSGGRARMIEHFKKNAETSALFGTDSFWEGIDIPGKDLETLIIYKFPFAVPSDPVFKARSRLYRDSFAEYALPAMILKLRQGLGRLIRTKSDRGIIVLLDARINSAWGQKIKEWFPEGVKIRTGTREAFLQMLQKKKL